MGGGTPARSTLAVLMPFPDALPTVHGITVEMHRSAKLLPRFGVRAEIATRRVLRGGRTGSRIDGIAYHHWLPPISALIRELAHPRSAIFPDRYLRLEAAALERLMRRRSLDLLHVREPWAAFTGITLSERVGVPFLLSLHTFSPVYYEAIVRGRPVHSDAGARWTAWLIAHQDRVPVVVAVSQDVADRYADAGLDRSRMHVIHHGVPDTFFDADVDSGLHRRFGFAPEDSVVAVVGRLEPAKGQRDAIMAFAEVRRAVPRLRLALLGGSAPYELPEAADLRRLAADLGVAECVGIGFVPPDEMPAAIASATLILAPSRIYEGFCKPAAEAAAAGRPVVATTVGALPEVVADGLTGLLVPPSDPTALARAMIDLLADDARRAAMGVAARERARARFTLERSVRAYADLYRSLATPTGR